MTPIQISLFICMLIVKFSPNMYTPPEDGLMRREHMRLLASQEINQINLDGDLHVNRRLYLLQPRREHTGSFHISAHIYEYKTHVRMTRDFRLLCPRTMEVVLTGTETSEGQETLIPCDLSLTRRWRRVELAQPRGSEHVPANTVSFSDQKPLYCT
jgi:hypothetical protein